MSDPLPSTALARPEPWLSTVLRVLVHGVTAGVIAYPLTVPEAVLAAIAGAGAGSLLARFVARSALRLPAIVLLGLASSMAVLVLRFVVVDLSFVPELLGPSGALKAGDAVVFGLGSLVVSTVLRAISSRRPSFGVLEAAIVAGGFATLLVAHRNGAIHRPYEIADPLIARGEDPTLAILLIGAAGAAVIVLLLISERSLVRSALHLGVVAALLLLILATTTMNGLPTPPSTGGALGLQDDEGAARRNAGGGQGQQGRRESDELEFLDQYPSGAGAPDAIVIFHDDYSPPTGYYYFRQSAFSQYNGRKLVTAVRDDVDRDVRNMFPTNRSREVAWVPSTALDRTTVETTMGLLADNSAPAGLEAPARFVPATNPNPQRFRRLYRVHSNAFTSEYDILLGRPGGDPAWSPEVREHYLRGPDDPRYRELAERIVNELPPILRDDAMAKALAITQYLGQHGTYSLRSRHASATDPTADFLFGDLTGYCVHFAHAAVYLMRAAGVPSRVGTGYAVAEANRQGGSALLLRNSDQHAWPEVYLGAPPTPPLPELMAVQTFVQLRDEGELASLPEETAHFALEVVVDAAIARHGVVRSPQRTARVASIYEPFEAEAEMQRVAIEGHQTLEQLLASAIAYASALPRQSHPDAGWVVADVAPENVLDPPGEPPDPQLQRLLGEMARGSEALEDAPQPPRPMAVLVRELGGPLLMGLGMLLGALITLLYSVKLYRRSAPSFVPSPRSIYRAALDLLSEGGLRREWGESHEAFARRLARQVPSLRPLTATRLASAFGRRPNAQELAAMAKAHRELSLELRRAVPLWRRALGIINPFSWLLTR